MGFREPETTQTPTKSMKDYRDAASIWVGNSGIGGNTYWSTSGDSLQNYVNPGNSAAVAGFSRPALSAIQADGMLPGQAGSYWADGVNGTAAAHLCERRDGRAAPSLPHTRGSSWPPSTADFDGHQGRPVKRHRWRACVAISVQQSLQVADVRQLADVQVADNAPAAEVVDLEPTAEATPR